jgi:excisionase family DNA binding protein
MEQLAVPIPAFTKALGIGRTKAYELIEAREVEAIKIGRRTLITVESIKALVDRAPRQQGS